MRAAGADLIASAVAALAVNMVWVVVAAPHSMSTTVWYAAWAACFATARLARAEALRRHSHDDV